MNRRDYFAMPAARHLFGVGHDLSGPIGGVPAGAKVRVRQRQADFVVVYVRTPGRIEQWSVCAPEGRPTLGILLAINGVSCT